MGVQLHERVCDTFCSILQVCVEVPQIDAQFPDFVQVLWILACANVANANCQSEGVFVVVVC
jgi:hypothetical protein